MRLASAILIGFGVSNLLPLFFTYWIGTSELSPPDLTDPARVASLLSNPATTNTVVRQIRLNLSADTTKLLASYGSETNQAARDRVVGMLTNLFNQSLTNPALRTAAALPGFAAGAGDRGIPEDGPDSAREGPAEPPDSPGCLSRGSASDPPRP